MSALGNSCSARLHTHHHTRHSHTWYVEVVERVMGETPEEVFEEVIVGQGLEKRQRGWRA